jgi:hypothetical protein
MHSQMPHPAVLLHIAAGCRMIAGHGQTRQREWVTWLVGPEGGIGKLQFKAVLETKEVCTRTLGGIGLYMGMLGGREDEAKYVLLWFVSISNTCTLTISPSVVSAKF